MYSASMGFLNLRGVNIKFGCFPSTKMLAPLGTSFCCLIILIGPLVVNKKGQYLELGQCGMAKMPFARHLVMWSITFGIRNGGG